MSQPIIISLLGFSSATPEYRSLARSLVSNPHLAQAELWAFETDRPYLEETGFPNLGRLRLFPSARSLVLGLHQSQLLQPVVLNPLGVIPLKTFALPTIGFTLPPERSNLWAPIQAFGSPSQWEGFADFTLASTLVVFCAPDGIPANCSFTSFQDFVHHMGLIPRNRVLEASEKLMNISEACINSWISQSKFSEVSWTTKTAPLVSVVTPSFNHARFIEKTIKSVLNQSYPNFEYIVVDGGSNDGTIDILKSYGQRLTWISEPDRGYADAVRKGFDRARGKFLCWLPSDDEFFNSESLSVLVSAIQRAEADVVYGNCIYVDEASVWLDQYKTSSFSVARLHNWCLIPQPSTLFSAEVYRRVQGINPDLVSVADYDLWLRVAEAGGRFARIGTPISKYRLHSSSITTSKTASTYAEIIRLQMGRYGGAFPGWISGAIGEIIHHLKGRPQMSIGDHSHPKTASRFRLLLRSNFIEPVVVRVPFLQTMLASILNRIDVQSKTVVLTHHSEGQSEVSRTKAKPLKS